MEIDGAWKGWPSLEIARDTFLATPSLIQVEPGRFVTWWEPSIRRDGWHEVTVEVNGEQATDTAGTRVYLQSVRQGKEGAVVSLDGRYSLFHAKQGLSFSSFVHFQPRSDNIDSRKELSLVDTPLKIEPDFLHSNRKFVLSADLPDTLQSPGNVGLYRLNPVSNRWDLISHEKGVSKWSREGAIHQGGTVGLLRDKAPPTIESVSRVNNTTIRVRCVENGSGIDRGDISVRIEGHPVNFRWLENKQWLELTIPSDTSLSSRELTVEISDRSGQQDQWKGVIQDI